MRRPRRLSPEERDLWNLVAKRAKPLGPDRTTPVDPTPAVTPQKKKVGPVTNDAPLPDFRVGQAVDHHRTNDLVPSLVAQMSGQPIQMDNKSFGKMKRGKLVPEGRIDLHGMTLSEAHPALTSFILHSHEMGRRLVLVITGKGKLRDYEAPMPVRQGILRHQVPQWLNLPPLRARVLQVTPAHIRHGGQGAYYVYLRRGR